MNRINRVVILFLLAALVLSACQPIQASSAQGPTAAPAVPQGLRPDAPTYAIHGPYGVGTRASSVDAGDHMVDLILWYPALNPDGAKEDVTYTISEKNANFASLPVSGRAILNATPDTARGPYPLLVFSPGLAGWAQENSYLLEHLASYGFVVMAMDPRGETFEEFWQGAGTRPVDTRLTIDYADTLTAPGGEMAGLIDTDKIATAGHSSGGWAALMGGGAQMDLGWCAANPELVAENDLSNCTQFVPHADEIATLLSHATTPDALWPPMNDPRVDAVLAIAPDGDIWGAEYEGVAALQVPTLIMGGSGDTINIPERTSYPIYKHLGSVQKSFVVFEGGDHMMFANQCRDVSWLLPDLFWACSDPVWDMDRAHDLVNHFATAFLLAELKGDTAAATALAPENVDFPGIQYETTAYTDTATAAPSAPALDPALTAKINEYVATSVEKDGVPGLAVGVVKDGALVYAEGFGVQNLETGEAVTPETLFLGAEMTFAPTTLAVLKLAEEGKLNLDAPITEYLPYFEMRNGDSGRITARQILSHRSGIPDSDQIPELWNITPALDEAATEEWARGLAERNLSFEPGTSFEFSNLAFVVLGAVVTAASGMPYEQYVRENVFAPLGMEQSTLLLDEADPALLASSHVADDAGGRQVTESFPWHRPLAGANNLITNVNDMSKLAAALLHGGKAGETPVISPETLDSMWTSLEPTPYADFLFGVETPSGLMQEYGQGWFIGDIGGERVYDAFGNEEGFSNLMVVAPEAGVAVIVLGNGSVLEEYYAANIATDVMAIVLEGSK